MGKRSPPTAPRSCAAPDTPRRQDSRGKRCGIEDRLSTKLGLEFFPHAEPGQFFECAVEQQAIGGIVEPAADARGVWQWHVDAPILLEDLTDSRPQRLFSEKD